MKTALKRAEELLESSAAKGINQIVERAKGLALVSLAMQLGRIASNLELVATNLQALVVEVGKHTQKENRY